MSNYSAEAEKEILEHIEAALDYYYQEYVTQDAELYTEYKNIHSEAGLYVQDKLSSIDE